MKTIYMAIVMIVGMGMFETEQFTKFMFHPESFGEEKDTIRWDEKGINWLINSQSKNGGWGAGSHYNQQIRDPQAVHTDPGTTAFAAMALLKAGGELQNNPYKKNIIDALERILEDIETRPANGRITSLSDTQLQRKLGANIDASLALEFLTEIRKQINSPEYEIKIDSAATICIELLEKKQNARGGWEDGGWAPVLQSAMANNALQNAKEEYAVNDSVLTKSIEYQTLNATSDGLNVTESAGIPLYVAASIQNATQSEAKEVEIILNEVTVVGHRVPLEKKSLSYAISTSGVKPEKAKRMARSYIAYNAAKKEIQKEETWIGFGNNGGEEYLSYKLTSETLAKDNTEEWIAWKEKIEPKFKESQNPNGSWSGHHCITSPVFCTAAILLSWYAGNEKDSSGSVK